MILVDTGFPYALLDEDDAWNPRAVAASRTLKEKWITTWPVLTEAVHLVTRWLGATPAIALVQDVTSGDVAVWDMPPESRQKLPALLRRYADLPMDLRGASLVLLAEALGHGRILTTDERDFRTYRWKSGAPFENLLASGCEA